MTTSSRKRWRRLRSLAEAAERRLVVPTRRMALFAALGSAGVALGYALGAGGAALLLLNAALLVASALDIGLLPRRHRLRFRRELPERADRASAFAVKLHAESDEPLELRLTWQDDVPQTFRRPAALPEAVWSGTETELRYETEGRERGRYLFRFLRIRLHGPLGLWMKQVKVDQEQTMDIYPDMSGVRGVLQSAQHDVMLEGRRIIRRERSGSQLHAIREYVPDDDPRLINWKATARAGTLMTSEFRPERGKTVMVMLDCGRMMGVELDDKTRLDVTIEAALTLAAVALKQGDKVGLLAFSSEVKTYIPPGGGMMQLQTLTRAVYNLQSEFVESSYRTALQYLMRVQRKRSMTVLFSDLDQPMMDDGIQALLMRLRKTHHLLLIGIQDEVLHAWTVTETANRRQAYIKSLAHKFTLDRQALLATLQAAGIEAVHVPAGEMAWLSVNRYLQVRAKDLL